MEYHDKSDWFCSNFFVTKRSNLRSNCLVREKYVPILVIKLPASSAISEHNWKTNNEYKVHLGNEDEYKAIDNNGFDDYDG
ncbi:8175_t:CDS:2 [Entrophospora sp. SA101]|nr:5991_t:CDS:2 [Entrophospora sp. SA101]CAJ0846603.1 8175_t:CDS:2 [Entrophospora sp. SA101]